MVELQAQTPEVEEQEQDQDSLPGSDLAAHKMPGHWLLARLGKRVLRPGGLGLTKMLLEALNVSQDDHVVEFAPGLGVTAKLLLENHPSSYRGIERDEKAAEWTRKQIPEGPDIKIVVGKANETTLEDASASVVMGEAMLTMNTQQQKQEIVAEAFRLLSPGGRYGIHELCIVPADMDKEKKLEIDRELSAVINIGARPLSEVEWKGLLEEAGFHVETIEFKLMSLLRPERIIADEGIAGAIRFAKNVALDKEARDRVLAMRAVFEKYKDNLRAVAITARKKIST